jgi:hypothetical protein
MEVNRVCHRAVGQVPQVDFNRIAHAHSEERTRHFAIECPILIGGAIGELSFNFHRFQVDADGLRLARRDRGGDFGGVTDNIGARCNRVIHNYRSTDGNRIAYR